MGKKFFSLLLSTILTASAVFAIVSVSRTVVNKTAEWNYVEPVKIVNIGSPYKHHYDKLTTNQKHTYNEILKAVDKMPERIRIPSTDKESLDKVMTALLDDNPGLYFLKGYREIQNYGFRTYCRPDYAMTKDEYREAEKIISEVCENVISGLSSPRDQWQTELEINDYIVDNCEYKFDGSNGFAYSTVYSVFVNGTAACEGYSKAAKLLFDMAGIESMTVRGESINNQKVVDHMWNIVKINGDYYNYDCTWNDPVPCKDEKAVLSFTDKIRDKQKRYYYLNLSDEMIKDTHTPEENHVECTATKENYFNKTVIMFDKYDQQTEEKIAFIVGSTIENGKDYVSFRFLNEDDYERAVYDLGTNGKINKIFKDYEKKNGRKIKADNVYGSDEEQKILVVIEYTS